MAELSGKSSKLRITAINPTSSTGEAMTLTQSTGGDYVQINDTGKRHWDRNVSTGFTLYFDSTAVAESNYNINWVQGKFEYVSTGVASSTGTFTADVEYLPTSYLGQGQSWDVTIDVDMLERTSFSTSTSDVQWRTYAPGLSGWSGTVEKLISTGDTGPAFFDRLNLPVDVITEFVTHDFHRFEGYARVQSVNIGAPIDGLLAESVNLSGDGPLYESSS